MATQVEALLPANPLLPAEEHGLVIKKPQEKGEHLMHQGEKANADEGKGGGPDSCSKEEGGGGGNVGDHLRRNGALLKPPSIKQQKEDSNHQEKENLLHQRSSIIESNRLPGEASSSSSSGGEEGGEQGGVGRKEFIEAPPPKVNPWTKNAPAALVTLNGQSPPGFSGIGAKSEEATWTAPQIYYFYNDDTFNFNYAQAKAATGNTSEAEEVFLLIQSEKIKNDFVYLSWLARCYIMNKKPRLAWELYLKMETSGESFSLLQLIANDCYKMGQFYYSAKAFDVLERLDPNPEYWEGKRGACVGIFQMIVAGREPKDTLREVLHLLRSSGNPQVEYIVRIIKKWAKENRVAV